MKATLIGFALLMSGTAIAQTTSTDAGTMTNSDTQTTTSSTTPDTTGRTSTDTQTSTDAGTMADSNAQSSSMTDTSAQSSTMTSAQSSTMTDQGAMSNQNSMTMASGATIQAGNTNPEKDARGITVMSDAATVPAGWNGMTGSAVGGPLVDPASGQTVSGSDSYPPCSATVTDNCLQSYERGRSS